MLTLASQLQLCEVFNSRELSPARSQDATHRAWLNLSSRPPVRTTKIPTVLRIRQQQVRPVIHHPHNRRRPLGPPPRPQLTLLRTIIAAALGPALAQALAPAFATSIAQAQAPLIDQLQALTLNGQIEPADPLAPTDDGPYCPCYLDDNPFFPPPRANSNPDKVARPQRYRLFGDEIYGILKDTPSQQAARYEYEYGIPLLFYLHNVVRHFEEVHIGDRTSDEDINADDLAIRNSLRGCISLLGERIGFLSLRAAPDTAPQALTYLEHRISARGGALQIPDSALQKVYDDFRTKREAAVFTAAAKADVRAASSSGSSSGNSTARSPAAGGRRPPAARPARTPPANAPANAGAARPRAPARRGD